MRAKVVPLYFKGANERERKEFDPSFKKLIIIKAEIEDYVQYPGSDCRNGALIRYSDGHKVMDSLSSHHALILVGDQAVKLELLAKVFGWETLVL